MRVTKEWPKDRVGRLVALAKEGLSAAQIASSLGDCTRNAVLGKLMRLKIGLMSGQRGSDRAAPRKRTHRPAPRRPLAVSRLTGMRTAVKAGPVLQPAPEPQPRASDVARVGLLDLERHHCRYPIGHPDLSGFGFCGLDHVPGTPYCADHLHRCNVGTTYVPRKHVVHTSCAGTQTEAAVTQEFLETV